MRAFLLLCLLGLSLAQNDLSLFAPFGTSNGDATLSGSSANVPFSYTLAGSSNKLTNLQLSVMGAVFPGSSVPSNPSVSVAYNSVTYPVVGPLWSSYSNAAGAGTVYYRTTQNQAFLNQWQAMVNPQFSATDAFIATWYQMTNPSFPGKTVTFQLVILADNSVGSSGATYAFHLYAEIEWFALGNMAAGFSNGVPSSGSNYESPYSSTAKLQSVKGKAGQQNFFYKLSINPYVDAHLTSNGNSFTTPSSQYLGMQFKANADSHGPTAFNFFRPAKVPGNAPLAYAVPSSYLYCFTSQYEGFPEDLSTAHHFAKSNVAGLTNVWEFPSNHNFIADTVYWCYCDQPTTQSIVTVPIGSKRSPINSLIANSGQQFTTSSSNYAYQLATILFSTAVGDPLFKSLRTGDSFVFAGEAGKHFNIYQDRYANINAEFDFANQATKEGTLIKAVGVSVGGHKISLAAADLVSGRLSINLDGKLIKLGSEKVHLSGCVDIHFLSQWNNFYIVSPTHKLKFTFDERHSEHLNGNFIDISIEDTPEAKEDVESLGGVIGATIKAGPINTNPEDFVVSGLFATGSNFKAAEFEDCV